MGKVIIVSIIVLLAGMAAVVSTSEVHADDDCDVPEINGDCNDEVSVGSGRTPEQLERLQDAAWRVWRSGGIRRSPPVPVTPLVIPPPARPVIAHNVWTSLSRSAKHSLIYPFGYR